MKAIRMFTVKVVDISAVFVRGALALARAGVG
jgi:hypothetical protein